MRGEKEGPGEAVFSRCLGGRVRRRAVLAVDGRIVIVALYHIHIVGVTGCAGVTRLEEARHRRRQRKEMTGQLLCRARAESGRIVSVIRGAL